MGKYVQRQTPKTMPGAERIAPYLQGMPKAFMVAGSRGHTAAENRAPSFEVHGQYRITAGKLDDLAGKHVLLFTHGYNNTSDDALKAAQEFFTLMHASLKRDGADLKKVAFVLFTWPGDTGPVFFNEAQEYAQHSGVAMYRLLADAYNLGAPTSVSLVSHSLGAHVVLRCLSVLGERAFRSKAAFRVKRALLLAPAVENDVFERPERSNEYHFPEAAFGVEYLHMGVSRADDVLSGAFRVNEADIALGYSGPESMSQLSSLSRRVEEVSGGAAKFLFEVHDFSPTSATIMNPALHVKSHGGYWEKQMQTDYYVNLVHRA